MDLPLFPLHTVLFPGRPLPLHIFEPRYQHLIEDLVAGDRLFGVISIRNGLEVGGQAQLYEIGTVARLMEVQPLPDGRADISSRGETRFRIVRMLNGRPYARAEVELLDDPTPGVRAQELANAVRSALAPYLCALGAPQELMDHLPTEPHQLAYLAASSLQTDLPEQQRLLELDCVEDRLAATLRLLRRERGIAAHLGPVGSLRPSGPGGADLN